jgi:ABC-type multidrug transport system ATPase subunit
MIELLGVGLCRPGSGWMFRRVCARIEPATFTVVTGERGAALLDVITGRAIADEGRVWVDGVPVMRDSIDKVRRIIADVSPDEPLAEASSLIENVLATPGRSRLSELFRPLGHRDDQTAFDAIALVGLTSRTEDCASVLSDVDRRRLMIARALVHGPRHLVVRHIDHALDVDEARELLAMLRSLSDRGLTVMASIERPAEARPFATAQIGVA